MCRDKGVIVDVCEESHRKLAVHAVSHTAVARNRVAKILDLECALETRSEESTEWGDERRECGQDQGVQLNGRHSNAKLAKIARQEDEVGHCPRRREEGRVRVTGEAGEHICSQVLEHH